MNKIFFINLNLTFSTPLDYWYVLFPFSFHSFLFLQIVLFSACFSLWAHIRGFPKMPGNPGFFIVFESEGPESWLIISSLCMWWKLLILRFTVRLLDQAICWGSLNVSPFRPCLLRWPDFPRTNSLNLCPEGKSCLEYSGKMRVDLRRKFHHAVCRCSVISLGSCCCCYSAPAFNFSLCPPSPEILSFKFSTGWRWGSYSG